MKKKISIILMALLLCGVLIGIWILSLGKTTTYDNGQLVFEYPETMTLTEDRSFLKETAVVFAFRPKGEPVGLIQVRTFEAFSNIVIRDAHSLDVKMHNASVITEIETDNGKAYTWELTTGGKEMRVYNLVQYRELGAILYTVIVESEFQERALDTLHSVSNSLDYYSSVVWVQGIKEGLVQTSDNKEA